ncbi:hypothetical protein OGAPHI_004918 [Ogataea philodendri]|uniref:Uncharacterized protein n=1 Tax=Ogataea philodendri TaxID=1378263 RepID=A0A9P8P1N2_9ASCO|nr:uncharacterized protein OGAPHI_004918 [Ogataea philodendri]KAH3663517.1 hypothetical protein OGAPHI_004918 [Ogataea philodendri]
MLHFGKRLDICVIEWSVSNHTMEDGGLSQENTLDVLQCAPRGFWTEEENSHCGSGVGHRENDVCFPSEVLGDDRGDHSNHEVGDPVCRGADGSTLGSELQWQNFCTIDPWNTVHGGSEKGHVGEEEGHRTGRALLSANSQQDSDHHHRHHLSQRSRDQRSSSSNFVQPQSRDETEEEEGNHDTATKNGGDVGAHSNVALKHHWHVVDNKVDTSELVPELHKHG